VTNNLLNKIQSSKSLSRHYKFSLIFVDSFYQRKDPKHGKERLNKFREIIDHHVFRTCELTTLKPRISELTNILQVMRSSQPISMMQPIVFDDSVKIEEWEMKPELPEGLRIDPIKGTILGTPSKVLPRTTFSLSARSIGGWSEKYSFTLEIGHSDIEMKSLILVALKAISTVLEDLFPVDSMKPLNESEIKEKINKAHAIGLDTFKTKVEELKKNYGNIITFDTMIELFHLEYIRKIIQLEKDFLLANQKMCYEARERDRERESESESEIEKEDLTIRETNMMSLKEQPINNNIAESTDVSDRDQ
jgi:hypothetical protein